MNVYLQIAGAQIHGVVTGAYDGVTPEHTAEINTEVPVETLVAEYGWYNDTLTHIGPAPSPWHVVDPATPGWVPNITALASELIEQVKALRNAATFANVTFGGDPFDADPEAREAISETHDSIARGEGLPPGWIGWRDANNVMHWETSLAVTVGAHLKTIRKSIIDRHQGLFAAAVTHVDAIRALAAANDAAALLSYDVTTGWP